MRFRPGPGAPFAAERPPQCSDLASPTAGGAAPNPVRLRYRGSGGWSGVTAGFRTRRQAGRSARRLDEVHRQCALDRGARLRHAGSEPRSRTHFHALDAYARRRRRARGSPLQADATLGMGTSSRRAARSTNTPRVALPGARIERERTPEHGLTASGTATPRCAAWATCGSSVCPSSRSDRPRSRAAPPAPRPGTTPGPKRPSTAGLTVVLRRPLLGAPYAGVNAVALARLGSIAGDLASDALDLADAKIEDLHPPLRRT